MKKKIGVLGSGVVAQALAGGFLRHGYEVAVGTRDIKKLEAWKPAVHGKPKIGSFAEAAAFGELIVLAVKGTAAEEALKLAGLKSLAGKTILDTTNPIADAPPTNGVLQFFTSMNESLMERLQRLVPEAHFVKAFNSVGSALMVNPNFGKIRPSMFLCGDNAQAKRDVTTIIEEFAWEACDMGTKEAARAIEPLCMLWCIPGFQRNDWSHAFKLLSK